MPEAGRFFAVGLALVALPGCAAETERALTRSLHVPAIEADVAPREAAWGEPVAPPVRAWVTTDAGDDFANRCAIDPAGDLVRVIDADPGYVDAYQSGRSACGVWAPTTGDGLAHHQGIQRVNRDARSYFLVSSSVKDGAEAGFEVVQMGSRPRTLEALGGNVVPFALPPCADHVVAYLGDPAVERDHAGGIQAMGRFVVVPLESSAGGVIAGFRLADLGAPTSPEWTPITRRTKGQTDHAGAAAMARLADGRFVVLVFGEDSDDVEIFVSSSAALPGIAGGGGRWISVAHAATPGDFEAYQNVQLVVRCDGALHVIATHKAVIGGADWADLWALELSELWAPTFTKVAERKLRSASPHTGGARYCDFQAGAGGYVSGAGRLAVYGVEHYNDAVPGTRSGVKVREFF